MDDSREGNSKEVNNTSISQTIDEITVVYLSHTIIQGTNCVEITSRQPRGNHASGMLRHGPGP
jgi:hypothetical protein